MRTNSESVLSVTVPRGSEDLTRRVAITGSIYPDADTHIETVVYGKAGGSMSWLNTLMVGDGTRVVHRGPLVLADALARGADLRVDAGGDREPYVTPPAGFDDGFGVERRVRPDHDLAGGAAGSGGGDRFGDLAGGASGRTGVTRTQPGRGDDRRGQRCGQSGDQWVVAAQVVVVAADLFMNI